MPNTFNQTSSAFLASLDAEIERLQFIRRQIADVLGSAAPAKKAAAIRTTKRKGMSEEGRRRVAAAQKARWAKQKKRTKTEARKTAVRKAVTAKASAKKAPAKKIATKKALAAKTSEQA